MFSMLSWVPDVLAARDRMVRFLAASCFLLTLNTGAQAADPFPPVEALPKPAEAASETGKAEPPAETTPPASTPPSEETVRQAEEHYKRGTQAIQAKDWQTAITALEAAVKAIPDKGNYHHALGVAYMGDQQANAGWFHFRQAVRLTPDYVPATVDFMKTWKLLDAQGVFNVGTPLPLVAQTLGKPDQADDQGSRLRLVYGFMSLNFMNSQLFSILDLRSLPPEGLHAVDGLAFDLDRDQWKVAYRLLSSTQGNTEYVPTDQSLQSWTQLFASQRFINTSATSSARDVMQGIRQRLESGLSNVEFEVLKDEPGDVLFTWSVPRNEQRPAQQEVVRIVSGERDIHRLAYSRKGETLDKEGLEPWIKMLAEAELMTAAELRAYLAREEEKQQEEQLREISVQILSRQFELIREGKTDEPKVYFVDSAREKITQELLERVSPRLDQLKPEELVDQVDLTTEASGLKARLLDKQGTVFTTLIQSEGRWFAENVWLETVIK